MHAQNYLCRPAQTQARTASSTFLETSAGVSGDVKGGVRDEKVEKEKLRGAERDPEVGTKVNRRINITSSTYLIVHASSEVKESGLDDVNSRQRESQRGTALPLWFVMPSQRIKSTISRGRREKTKIIRPCARRGERTSNDKVACADYHAPMIGGPRRCV